MSNPDYPKKSNEKYTGFCMDMIKQIQEELDFEYDIHLVGDGKYGDINQDMGRWTGMIQEVIEWVCITFPVTAI